MAQAPRKKATYPSAEQKTRLLELLAADPELSSGKLSAHFTKKMAQRRWKAIAVELNAIGAATKTWEEWRKTYQDKKSKIRRKFRTDGSKWGGSPVEELTHMLLEDGPNVYEKAILNHGATADCSDGIGLTVTPDVSQVSTDSADGDTSTASNDTEVLYNNSLAARTAATAAARGASSNEGQGCSLDTAVNELKLERASKEAFYRDVMKQLKRHSDAMESIAKSLASKNNL